MTDKEALDLISPAIQHDSGIWADIGAGTGTFVKALASVLDSGTIMAIDKNPHALWNISPPAHISLEILEADFTKSMKLPSLDGIVMANALHYAQDPVSVMVQLGSFLKPNSPFIVIEYETSTPRPPWIPNPIPFARFEEICLSAGMQSATRLATVDASYGHEHIYSAATYRK